MWFRSSVRKVGLVDPQLNRFLTCLLLLLAQTFPPFSLDFQGSFSWVKKVQNNICNITFVMNKKDYAKRPKKKVHKKNQKKVEKQNPKKVRIQIRKKFK